MFPEAARSERFGNARGIRAAAESAVHSKGRDRGAQPTNSDSAPASGGQLTAGELLVSRRESGRKGDAKLRVVAGSLRGRNLAGPPAGVRPTSDRVRESIFGRLGALEGATVLDLFAGTGALGIEALSRGADRLVALDRSLPSVKVIQRNFDELGVASQARVMRVDVRTGLRRLARDGERFELVFLDPPYAEQGELRAVLEALVACDILGPAARVIVEGPKSHSLPGVPGLSLETTRQYGDTAVHWLSRDSKPGDESLHNGRTTRNG